ncbi:MAG: lipocalin family protein [Bacteroidetes bacterium]|nr:lipocalin family protein [Bacteroidota bacterium]
MNKFLILALILFPLCFCDVSAQDNVDTLQSVKIPVKQFLCKKWLSSSYTEDGKKGNDLFMFIEFQNNGKYVYIEDDNPIKDDTWAEYGTWEIVNDNILIFDKGTEDEDRMNIVTIDDKTLNVNYNFNKVLMNITFIPGNFK